MNSISRHWKCASFNSVSPCSQIHMRFFSLSNSFIHNIRHIPSRIEIKNPKWNEFPTLKKKDQHFFSARCFCFALEYIVKAHKIRWIWANFNWADVKIVRSLHSKIYSISHPRRWANMREKEMEKKIYIRRRDRDCIVRFIIWCRLYYINFIPNQRQSLNKLNRQKHKLLADILGLNISFSESKHRKQNRICCLVLVAQWYFSRSAEQIK